MNFLWIVYFSMLVLWVISSAILSFHWRSYAKGDLTLHRATIAYYAGSILILIVVAILFATL